MKPTSAPRGRGTASKPHNRFAPTSSEAEDDGWYQAVSYTHLTLPTIYSV